MSVVDLQSCKEKLEQVLAEFPKFVADPTTNEENILKWLKDFASELDSFKKACVIVPRKKLEELMERFPKYRRSGICSREIGEFKDWFEKLKRVLGVEK